MTDKSSLSRRHFICMPPLAAAALTVGGAEVKESPIPSPDYTIPENGFHGRDENRRDWSGDPRSGKVVFVSHCMLNQNARFVRVAGFPAMFDPLVDYLQKTQAGVIQMPCPELYCIGLGRRAVRVGLESPAGMKRLQRVIDDLVFTIHEYLFQGFEVVGILGIDRSPSCGVSRTLLEGRQQDGQGVFIRELKKRLAVEKLDIPVIGVADHKQNDAIQWLEERL
jgi:predicted secreted protein